LTHFVNNIWSLPIFYTMSKVTMRAINTNSSNNGVIWLRRSIWF